MPRLRTIAMVLCGLVFLGCDLDSTSPAASDGPPPDLALLAALEGPAPAGQYIVRYSGDAAALSREIQGFGGSFRAWPEIGYGVVAGVGASDLGKIAALPEVTRLAEDLTLQWIPGREVIRSTAYQSNGGVRADIDQSGAFFFQQFQWYLRQIDADDAWLTTNAGAGVQVAVLDTGVDPDHLDLSGVVNTGLSASTITPMTSPCGPLDEQSFFDFDFHGTAVSSLITSNGIGMASTAPLAEIVAVKVLNCSGVGSFGDVIAGIMYAAAIGSDVINMSLGAVIPQSQATLLLEALQDAIDFAVRSGTYVVASAGNDGLDFNQTDPDLIHVPSMMNEVLSVGATAPRGQQEFDALATYTNRGRRGVNIMAPGGDQIPPWAVIEDLIFAACTFALCGDEVSYIVTGGTSFASPLVAGLAAVVKGEGLSPYRCVRRGADRRSPQRLYNWGRANVMGSVAC